MADLTDAPRKLYHAEIDLPVTAGPADAHHAGVDSRQAHARGPASDSITGVVFTANGQTLAWRRDDVDLYQFHLTIPQGVTTLHAHLDCIVTERVSQKTGRAGVGKAAALSGQHAGARTFPSSPR